ncbi:MAG: ABC-type transporter, integral rane subunit, partial [Thermomicrobiales bacterium]|nr:ABC-type transporter, integral rane subunit [Thermomicrobiales bacterium]
MALTEAVATTSHTPSTTSGPWGLSSITPSSKYYWVRLLLQNPAAVASLGFLLLMLLLAIFAPAVAPFDPNFVNPGDRLEPPSSTYWFGTDDLGRDVFSRVIYGTRISLLVG